MCENYFSRTVTVLYNSTRGSLDLHSPHGPVQKSVRRSTSGFNTNTGSTLPSPFCTDVRGAGKLNEPNVAAWVRAKRCYKPERVVSNDAFISRTRVQRRPAPSATLCLAAFPAARQSVSQQEMLQHGQTAHNICNICMCCELFDDRQGNVPSHNFES